MFDGDTSKMYLLTPTGQDPLAKTHADQTETWRKLDVAILQHYIIEQVLQPNFNGGAEVERNYSPEVSMTVARTDGVGNRIAFLTRPTSISSLIELGKTAEVMPQKSTYFFPKLATGMVIAPLR